jgi:hypothetical protein
MSRRFEWEHEREDRETLRKHTECIVEAKRLAHVLYENATLLLQRIIADERIDQDRLGACADACDRLTQFVFTRIKG